MADLENEYRRRLIRLQISYPRKAENIFIEAAESVGRLKNHPSAKYLTTWNYKKAPALAREIVKIEKKLYDDIYFLTEETVRTAWMLSEKKNDERFKNIPGARSEAQEARRLAALTAFLGKSFGTESLSSTIWKVAGQARMEMELLLAHGIHNGLSAAEISKNIRQYLKNPDALFRRVRNKETGKLEPSKRMKEYKPGRGVYKSAYKNAMRVARTETNMAYLLADHERWLTLEMVLGVRVSLSGSHPEYDFEEICEVLDGDYPKEFVFIGWHPQCLCHAVPILSPQKDITDFLEGKTKKVEGKQIKDYPENFKAYVKSHGEKFDNMDNPPYWYSKNEKIIKNIREEKYVKGVNPIFKNVTTKYDGKILYRGDIRDKGESFSDAVNTKDYMLDGEIKNKAGFHWFTSSKSYAEDYALKQQSDIRGEKISSILTSIETKELNILDFSKMSLSDQIEFTKSTLKYGIKGQFYGEEKLLNYVGDITEANINKLLGYKTYGNILNNGQFYSDFDTGVLFKKWLEENGFEGYRFKAFSAGDDIALISSKMFKVLERIKIN